MSSGEHCGDDDAHGHGHSHDGAEPADGAAHGHGHSHGDGAGTPLVATDAKDGIVYYTAPDGRVLHSHDGCVRALENRSLPRHSSLRSSGPRVPSTLSPRASSSPSLEQPQAPQPRPHPRRRLVQSAPTAHRPRLLRALVHRRHRWTRRHRKDRPDALPVSSPQRRLRRGGHHERHLHPRRRRIPREAPGAGSLAHPRGRDRGCPHAAIREDISCNLTEAENLTAEHAPELILLESGGDNLAANFSRELADFIVYVIDVCGGDKIPRKGGPG